jgi:hypothetical protein
MIDLRYLALTLIAIFLALAVGLMTGSALGTPDRRDRVYEGLREQFELLRTQNQEVRQENDTVRRRIQSRDQALADLLPVIVRGRLASAGVGVIIAGDLDERPFWGALESALRESGAILGPVARVPDTLRELDSDSRTRFARQWGTPTTPSGGASMEVAGWITRAMARGNSQETVRDLGRVTGIDIRGEWSRPARRLLILTEARTPERLQAAANGVTPEARVIAVAQEERLRVVAAEPEEIVTSAVEPLRRQGVTTVDNIDTPGGQIAAILALAGADGQFGGKPGAGRALPPVTGP